MRRYLLPTLSGVLLALALGPWYIWPLAFVALAPLFYFAQQPRTRGGLFLGGCIAGSIGTLPSLYLSLFSLVMQPGAPLFTYAIRASSFLVLMVFSATFGVVALLYGIGRSKQPLLDSLLAASLYTVGELFLFTFVSGYYYPSVAHAVASFPPALIVASLGGVPLVIFVTAWTSAVLVQHSWRLVFGAGLCVAILCTGAYYYGRLHTTGGAILPIALIQRHPESLLYVTAPAPEPFGDYGLQTLIAEAVQGGVTPLVVYPFSPAEIIYSGSRPMIEGVVNLVPDAALGAWLKTFAPTSTTVVLWNTAATEGNLYDEFNVWRDGTEQTYQKHVLYPFSDYLPPWVRALGFARLPYTLTPGVAGEATINDVRLEGLFCSELQQEGYAREQAAQGDVLLSIGFDAMFPGAFAGDWSLAAARLRAAENGIPVIRSTISGPSGIVNADGSIGETTPYGSEGVMRGAVSVKKIATLYRYAGSAPAYAIMLTTLALVLYRRFWRSRSLYSADL